MTYYTFQPVDERGHPIIDDLTHILNEEGGLKDIDYTPVIGMEIPVLQSIDESLVIRKVYEIVGICHQIYANDEVKQLLKGDDGTPIIFIKQKYPSYSEKYFYTPSEKRV